MVDQEKTFTHDELIRALAAMAWQGDFGDGNARKVALGRYYQEVQNQVNKGYEANKAADVDLDAAKDFDPNAGLSVDELEQQRIDELAARSWRGDFGSGEERREKLGNDYDKVQARVNDGYEATAHVGLPDPDAPVQQKAEADVEAGAEPDKAQGDTRAPSQFDTKPDQEREKTSSDKLHDILEQQKGERTDEQIVQEAMSRTEINDPNRAEKTIDDIPEIRREEIRQEREAAQRYMDEHPDEALRITANTPQSKIEDWRKTTYGKAQRYLNTEDARLVEEYDKGLEEKSKAGKQAVEEKSENDRTQEQVDQDIVSEEMKANDQFVKDHKGEKVMISDIDTVEQSQIRQGVAAAQRRKTYLQSKGGVLNERKIRNINEYLESDRVQVVLEHDKTARTLQENARMRMGRAQTESARAPLMPNVGPNAVAPSSMPSPSEQTIPAVPELSPATPDVETSMTTAKAAASTQEHQVSTIPVHLEKHEELRGVTLAKGGEKAMENADLYEKTSAVKKAAEFSLGAMMA